MKFSDLGTDNLKDSSTFKKIQYFSKSNPQKLYSSSEEFNLKYKKISDLYLSDYETFTTGNYGLKRQHNFASQKSLLNNSSSLLDNASLNVMMEYNHGLAPSQNNNPINNSLKFHNHDTGLNSTPSSITLNKKLNETSNLKNNLSLASYLSFVDKNSLLAAENDSTQLTNPLKYTLNTK